MAKLLLQLNLTCTSSDCGRKPTQGELKMSTLKEPSWGSSQGPSWCQVAVTTTAPLPATKLNTQHSDKITTTLTLAFLDLLLHLLKFYWNLNFGVTVLFCQLLLSFEPQSHCTHLIHLSSITVLFRITGGLESIPVAKGKEYTPDRLPVQGKYRDKWDKQLYPLTFSPMVI